MYFVRLGAFLFLWMTGWGKDEMWACASVTLKLSSFWCHSFCCYRYLKPYYTNLLVFTETSANFGVECKEKQAGIPGPFFYQSLHWLPRTSILPTQPPRPSFNLQPLNTRCDLYRAEPFQRLWGTWALSPVVGGWGDLTSQGNLCPSCWETLSLRYCPLSWFTCDWVVYFDRKCAVYLQFPPRMETWKTNV